MFFEGAYPRRSVTEKNTKYFATIFPSKINQVMLQSH